MTTLENKPDTELVELIRDKSDSDCFNEVCRRYENIFYKVCQKYVNALSNCGVNPQDIFDDKNIIILHCISTFKPSKNTKLSTWIGNQARYLCLNSINKRKFIRPNVDNEDINQIIEDSQSMNNYFLNSSHTEEDYKYILNLLDQLQDPRIIEIFKYRYFERKRMIWAKVAQKMGISTQTAINLHNKGIRLMRRKLKSESISDIL